MGCCFSRPAGPNSPYPGGTTEIASQATPARTTEPSAELTTGLTAPEAAPNLAHSGGRWRSRRPLNQHVNKPLQRHTWTSTDRSWTKSQLARERSDFFDSRVSGRPEIWQALHAAVQSLWETAGSELPDDAAAGLATAQALLDAAEITLPTGSLVAGAYDALGNLYLIPPPILADPDNVLSDEDKKQQLSGDGEHAAQEQSSEGEEEEENAAEGGEQEADEGDDDNNVCCHCSGNSNSNSNKGDKDKVQGAQRPVKKRQAGKGKGLVEGPETIQLCARLSDSGKDITIPIRATDKVKSVIQKLAIKLSHDSDGTRIKLAYMGKVLGENASLEAQGWDPSHLVSALIYTPETPEPE